MQVERSSCWRPAVWYCTLVKVLRHWNRNNVYGFDHFYLFVEVVCMTKNKFSLIENPLFNFEQINATNNKYFHKPKVLLHLLNELYYPLLGRARFRGRCWATIRLFHRPEPSGRAVHGEANGLDIGGQHGRRFVFLRHTHRPQRRPYPNPRWWRKIKK